MKYIAPKTKWIGNKLYLVRDTRGFWFRPAQLMGFKFNMAVAYQSLANSVKYSIKEEL